MWCHRRLLGICRSGSRQCLKCDVVSGSNPVVCYIVINKIYLFFFNFILILRVPSMLKQQLSLGSGYHRVGQSRTSFNL